MRSILKSIRFLFILLFGGIFLLCALFALLQTQWAKAQVGEKILVSLEKVGIEAQLGPLQGSPPFSWKLPSIELITEQGIRFDLREIKFRIAFLPLLKGRFAISYLSVEKMDVFLKENEREVLGIEEMRELLCQKIDSLFIPYPLAIDRFKVAQLTLHSPALKEPTSCELQGGFKLYPQCDLLYISLSLSSLSLNKTFCDLLIDANRFQNRVDCQLKLDLMGAPLVFPERTEGEFLCNLYLNGPFTTFKSLLHDTPLKSAPVRGELRITTAGWMDLPYRLQTRFSIQDPHSIRVQKFLCASDLFHLSGKGVLHADLPDSQAVFLFSSADLNALSPLVSFPLSGTLKGKGFYKSGAFKTSFTTNALTLDHFNAREVLGMLSGSLEDTSKGRTWQIEAKISSTEAEIPFENAFKLSFTPEKELSFSDWALQTPTARAEGAVRFDLARRSLHGQVQAHCSDLSPFASLFKEEELNASLFIDGEMSGPWDDPSVSLSLSAEHIRYRDLLVDQCALSAEISELFRSLRGKVHLFAKQVYAPRFNLDELVFSSRSDEDLWPFHLRTNGEMKQPFACEATGFLRKEPHYFSLECTELFGNLAGLPFSLKYPALFEKDSSSVSLTPTHFQMGNGKLYTTFEMSPIHAVGTWKIDHFPLEVLNVLRPSLHLDGTFSSRGYLDARDSELSGNLNAIIEEASFLKKEKEMPLQAKGAIQAHLEKDHLQIGVNLQAIDAQIFDLTASLPVRHTLYPFAIQLEEEKPVSATLICEGKLEDLFDLVNLGINRLTGLVSSKLLLSHTLASPFLQGTIDWQHGTYENYFTGVQLRDIHAHFEAHQDTLSLKKLTATDEENGTVEGDGTILLKAQGAFPLPVHCRAERPTRAEIQYDRLHSLRSPLFHRGYSQCYRSRQPPYR